MVTIRKPARFHRTGGSRSVIVPKDLLEAAKIDEEHAEWELTEQGLLLRRGDMEDCEIEDTPEFATFLEILFREVFDDPHRLTNAATTYDEDMALIEGVELDD